MIPTRRSPSCWEQEKDVVLSDGLPRGFRIGHTRVRHKETAEIWLLVSLGGSSDDAWVFENASGKQIRFPKQRPPYNVRREVARLFEDFRLASSRPQDWLGDGI
jgi:hypothetical protein